MRIPVLVTAALLTVSCCVSGCGSAEPGSASEEPTSSSAPTSSEPSATGSAESEVQAAAGPELAAGGVSFHAPKGWVDVTEKSGSEPAVLLRAAKVGGDDVVPQIVVIRSDASVRNADAAARYAVQDLRSTGATRIETGAPVDIAGRAASAVTAVMKGEGTPMSVYRYDVAVDGTTWTIAYSDSRYRMSEDKQALIDSVLASWQWS